MYSAVFSDDSLFDAPCSKVVCVGRNYAEHAKELNNAIPDSPILFIKPESSIQADPRTLLVHKNDLHYEAELAVLIGRDFDRSSAENAADSAAENACKHLNAQSSKQGALSDTSGLIAGLGLAIDLTDRELQSTLKTKGHPWERAKGFKGACYLSPILPYKGEALDDLRFVLSLNGDKRQDGHSADMLFNVVELLHEIALVFGLKKGDIVLTGTPKGVGVLKHNDTLEMELDTGKSRLSISRLNVVCR